MLVNQTDVNPTENKTFIFLFFVFLRASFSFLFVAPPPSNLIFIRFELFDENERRSGVRPGWRVSSIPTVSRLCSQRSGTEFELNCSLFFPLFSIIVYLSFAEFSSCILNHPSPCLHTPSHKYHRLIRYRETNIESENGFRKDGLERVKCDVWWGGEEVGIVETKIRIVHSNSRSSWAGGCTKVRVLEKK